jgi:transposase InsO family protein
MSQVHPCARTTPRTRAEINASPAGATALASLYNITAVTARKWKGREDSEDRSHRPRTLKTTLTPAQEVLVVELRRMVLLPLDDLLAITREFINASVSRSGLDRCLRRHGVSDLKSLLPNIEGETPPLKTFKDYEPGFIHIDIKYLPQMPDETTRRYLFVAIDRATRWVYFRIYKNQTEVSSTDFLRRLKKFAPMKIQKILTDNGSQFTDRFTAKDKRATGKHAFDVTCAEMGIEHRLSPPRHPQTNGMVERFNGRISDLVKQTRFASAAELESTLTLYLKTYNHHIPQRALKHQTPIQALQKWQAEKPDLFVKRIYKQAGLDNYRPIPFVFLLAE